MGPLGSGGGGRDTAGAEDGDAEARDSAARLHADRVDGSVRGGLALPSETHIVPRGLRLRIVFSYLW